MEICHKNLYKELKKRHSSVFDLMQDRSIMVIFPSHTKKFSNDVEFPFRQNSNFFYLSGFYEDTCLLLLLKTGNKRTTCLLCSERNKQQELWIERRIGIQDVKKHWPFDLVKPLIQVNTIFAKLASGCYCLYCDIQFPKHLARCLKMCEKLRISQGNTLSSCVNTFIDANTILGQLRAKKSKYDLTLMRKAANISIQAHQVLWKACRPGINESMLSGLIEKTFVQHNSRPAYPSIVAGGKNACTLHYTSNSKELKDGGLLLVDAGAEYKGFASDITRTIPINGHFNQYQAKAYDIVLKTQTKVIESIKLGSNLSTLHRVAVRALTQGLVDMDILKGNIEKLIRDKAYTPYYMHGTGHWIGMDVHDISPQNKPVADAAMTPFEEGMAFTVEPGLYFRGRSKHVPRELHNCGIRIEDDVVVTKNGCEVLTSNLPKSIKSIEEAMQNKNCQKNKLE